MHPRVKKTLGRGIAVAALAFFAGPAVANACDQPPTTKTFAAFGDRADYWLAPGGNFETGASGWTLDASRVVSGTSSLLVKPSDSKSLEIQPGGAAVTPAFCVDATNTTLRLFAKKAPLTGGTLTVELQYTSATGLYKGRVGGVVAATGLLGWAPTAVLDLANALPPGQVAKGDGSVQLRFVASGDAGAWTIDDVYIDPYRFS